jgi:myosin heavy chain 6/7
MNRKLMDEIQTHEERIAQLNRSRQKLEQALDQAEDNLERERRARQELDKQRRKTEGELKIAHENLEEMGRQKSELENAMKKWVTSDCHGLPRLQCQLESGIIQQLIVFVVAPCRKDADLHQMATRLEEEQSLVARLQRQIKELLARVQELEEELDAERAARARAEKARAELQAENEELADRADEAGGLTQAQLELNKRREAEMAKLRREMVGVEQNVHN